MNIIAGTALASVVTSSFAEGHWQTIIQSDQLYEDIGLAEYPPARHDIIARLQPLLESCGAAVLADALWRMRASSVAAKEQRLRWFAVMLRRGRVDEFVPEYWMDDEWTEDYIDADESIRRMTAVVGVMMNDAIPLAEAPRAIHALSASQQIGDALSFLSLPIDGCAMSVNRAGDVTNADGAVQLYARGRSTIRLSVTAADGRATRRVQTRAELLSHWQRSAQLVWSQHLAASQRYLLAEGKASLGLRQTLQREAKNCLMHLPRAVVDIALILQCIQAYVSTVNMHQPRWPWEMPNESYCAQMLAVASRLVDLTDLSDNCVEDFTPALSIAAAEAKLIIQEVERANSGQVAVDSMLTYEACECYKRHRQSEIALGHQPGTFVDASCSASVH